MTNNSYSKTNRAAEAALAAYALICIVSAVDCFAGTGNTVYVSPRGDDRASGTKAAPVATLDAACGRLKGKAGGVVKIAPGFYELSRTVRLHGDDSSLRIEALDPENPPIISGGRRLSGWKTGSDGYWRLNIGADRRFSQLYVNDERRSRPYLPRKSYFTIGDKSGTPPGVRPTRFYARPGDVPENMRDIDLVEFCVFHYWSMSRSPLKSYDPSSRLVTLAGGVSRPAGGDLTEDFWYRLDNVREALGEVPGEWYLERDGTLVYVPRKGETPANTTVVAPRLERLVDIDGAENVEFRNIVFAHAGWNMPTNGHASRQAENGQGAWAVCAVRAENIVFDGCVFRNLGGGGLEFGTAAKKCIARNCEFFDLGSGGVHVGPGQEVGKFRDSSLDYAATKTEDYASDCMVTNCLIASGGRVQAGAVGVWITHAPRTRVIGNTIRDFYYSGISVGWKWALGPNSTWENVIADNKIGPIGQGVLSDMGGIYSLGSQPGTVLRGNYIHDVTTSRYGGYSIYFDSGSAFMTVSNNFVRGGETSWFMARISASNRVENNVFVDATRYPLCPLYRAPESSPSVFARNIVQWKNGSIMPEVHSDAVISFAGNFCHRSSSPLAVVPRGFTETAAPPADTSGRFFELPPSSPAIAGGFIPFSMDGAGCRLDCRTKRLPAAPSVYPPAPPVEEKPMYENFERMKTGGGWKGWVFHPLSAEGSSCRVSDERASRGRRSFCMTDDNPSYGPWIESFIHRKSGTLSISFDLFIEKGARPHFETRDSEAVCLSRGPFLAVDEQGRFRAANGAVLGTAPCNRWIHVELTCELGREAKKVYSARIEVPGEKAPRIHENLWMHPEFNSLSWLGWLALAKDNVRYFLDEFRISPPATVKTGKPERK